MLPGGEFDWSRFPLPEPGDFRDDGSSTHSKEDTQDRVAFRFHDEALASGIDFRFVNSYSPDVGRRIFETMGAGVGVLDYDLDGWPDLYFPQGAAAPTQPPRGPSDDLYRNLSGKRFVKVTDLAGIEETSYSQGVACGDYDNDGFPDVYVANLGRNRLFRNNGSNTNIRDITDGTSNSVAIAETTLNVGDGITGSWFCAQHVGNGVDFAGLNGLRRINDWVCCSWTTPHWTHVYHQGTLGEWGAVGSMHTGGMQVTLGDGAVRFISENINAVTRTRLGYIADGGVVGEF